MALWGTAPTLTLPPLSHQGGAFSNSSDAMVSAHRLMTLLVARPGAPGHALLGKKDALRLLLQVLRWGGEAEPAATVMCEGGSRAPLIN